MIAMLVSRLSGFVVNAHLSDGDSTWLPIMHLASVYLTFMY
jgi:hypothetical protein